MNLLEHITDTKHLYSKFQTSTIFIGYRDKRRGEVYKYVDIESDVLTGGTQEPDVGKKGKIERNEIGENTVFSL